MMFSKKKLALLALSALALSCGKKDSDDGADTPTDTYNGGGDPADQIPMSGTIKLSALRLAGETVTHVVALNTETGATSYSAVGGDGTYSLTIDKNEPWFISYINSAETGADMIVSTFAADTLDTVSAGDGSDGIAMGTVDASDDKAQMEGTTAAAFLADIDMSADAAATVGAVDDASLRYSNPDIDNNGKMDAEEEKSYLIDFHNRFTAKDSEGNPLDINDMKDKFYPDNVDFTYTGTGIMPQIPKDDLGGTAPDTYKWKFSVAMPTASNGGEVCEGMSAGDEIPANIDCTLDHLNNTGANGDDVFVFGMETANLLAGDYTLKVGSKTYTWADVAVSDFNQGEGFLALFIKLNTTGGKLTGLSYKWQIKGSDGKYSLAPEESIKLIVKNASDEADYGGYVSLKYKGNESKGSLGVMIPRQKSGSIVFKTAIEKDDGSVNVSGSELTEAKVKAGVPFTDFTENPGISYDDKLGMRFFF